MLTEDCGTLERKLLSLSVLFTCRLRGLKRLRDCSRPCEHTKMGAVHCRHLAFLIRFAASSTVLYVSFDGGRPEAQEGHEEKYQKS